MYASPTGCGWAGSWALVWTEPLSVMPGPTGPTGPGGPAAPGVPGGPCGPVGPAGPVAPAGTFIVSYWVFIMVMRCEPRSLQARGGRTAQSCSAWCAGSGASRPCSCRSGPSARRTPARRRWAGSGPERPGWWPLEDPRPHRRRRLDVDALVGRAWRVGAEVVVADRPEPRRGRARAAQRARPRDAAVVRRAAERATGHQARLA